MSKKELIKYLKEPLKWVKKSKGLFTKAGAYLNYREIHRFQYGIANGILIFRPKKLIEKAKADELSFKEWEKGNFHYQDKIMIYVYSVKWALILIWAPEAVKYAILTA